MAVSSGQVSADVEVLQTKLINTLERLCQDCFNFVNYVRVSGQLTFNVDGSQNVEIKVSHLVSSSVIAEDISKEVVARCPDGAIVNKPEAEKKKTTKRGRKAKCTGVKKKAQPGVSVKKKKRGRPRKVPAPVDAPQKDRENGCIKPELGKTGPDQECPVNETVDEEEEDPGLQDDGAIENDLQDEDYKPPKPLKRRKNLTGLVEQKTQPTKRKHLSVANSTNKVKCQECGHMFSDEEALKRHLSHMHVSCWRCPVCEPTVLQSTKNRLLKHLQEMHFDHPELWGSLFCDLCKLVFLSGQELQAHKAALHTHVCTTCGAEFEMLRHMLKHRMQEHPEQALMCSKCGKVCANKQIMYRHMERHREKEHGKYTCQLCNKEFTSRNSLFHHTRGLHSKEKKYKCKECNKEFNFHHSLKLHLYKHSGARPHKCGLCQKSYLTSNHLKNHVEAVHINSKKYVCNVCNKGFPYDNSLRMHMLLHDKERPFVCDQCGKSFVARSALKAHEELHMNESHRCTVCHKEYRTKMLLRAHMRRHTDDGHRYMCDICGNTFMYKSTLNTHMIVHGSSRSFECNICKKSYKTYATLYSHRLVHEETIPFTCKICGKGFKTRERVKAHEKRHAGEKPYQCEQCGSSFPDKGGLSKHNKTVHARRPRFQCPSCGKMANRADNLRVHMKIHNDPQLMELKVENLMMNVKPEEEEEVEADDTGSLPLPRRRRVVKKEPRVNIPLGSITTVSELNLDMVTGLTTELQQQIREQHQQQQQQQGAPLADPQQQQHIVAELPREITLTLEKVTLDKMATQGLLVDHMQKIQQQHQHQEELQVVTSVTTQSANKQHAMHKHLVENIPDFEKSLQKQSHVGAGVLHIASSQHLNHAMETIQNPGLHRLDQILDIGQQAGGSTGQGVNIHLHNPNTGHPSSQSIIVSQAPNPSVITNPLLHLAEVMSGQHQTGNLVAANPGQVGINYAAIQQYQPFVTTATQQAQPQSTASSFVQNFQQS